MIPANSIPLVERAETLSEQAYTRLRAALVSGVFKPGEALSIRRLAGLIGISATPARDAISRALWDGSLESGPNRTVLVPTLTVGHLEDIYAVRLNLESLATELAAPNFHRPVIAELEAIYEAYGKAIEAGDVGETLRLNESFHFFVYHQSGNDVLVAMIESLWLKMGPSLNLLFPAYSDRRGSRHKVEIIAALGARDGAKARAALEADLIDGRAEVKRALLAMQADSRRHRKAAGTR